jgi:hypothetical protein
MTVIIDTNGITAPTANITNTITANTMVDATGNTIPASTLVQGSAKAWVSYNASTTTIRSSFNCSSVTRSSATNYIFNAVNAFVDTNYATVCTVGGATNNYGLAPWTATITPSTTQIGFTHNGSVDSTYISLVVFR